MRSLANRRAFRLCSSRVARLIADATTLARITETENVAAGRDGSSSRGGGGWLGLGDVERDARVAQAVGEHVAHRRRGREDAAGVREAIAVEREAERAL